jgi:hypothetical protein
VSADRPPEREKATRTRTPRATGNRSRATATHSCRRDRRAVVPVVGKTLELAVALLFVGTVTTALYGGVVPDYRTAATDASAEELLTRVTERVETTVPPNATHVRTTVRIRLPGTIGEASYRIAADGSALVLRHPNRGVGARTRPSLPDRVDTISGSWTSGTVLYVVMRGSGDELHVRLTGERDR